MSIRRLQAIKLCTPAYKKYISRLQLLRKLDLFHLSQFILRIQTSVLCDADPPDPDRIEFYWDDDRSSARVDARSELVCSTERSHPPASFRFMWENDDITHLAKYERGDVDSNGMCEM